MCSRTSGAGGQCLGLTAYTGTRVIYVEDRMVEDVERRHPSSPADGHHAAFAIVQHEPDTARRHVVVRTRPTHIPLITQVRHAVPRADFTTLRNDLAWGVRRGAQTRRPIVLASRAQHRKHPRCVQAWAASAILSTYLTAVGFLSEGLRVVAVPVLRADVQTGTGCHKAHPAAVDGHVFHAVGHMAWRAVCNVGRAWLSSTARPSPIAAVFLPSSPTTHAPPVRAAPMPWKPEPGRAWVYKAMRLPLINTSSSGVQRPACMYWGYMISSRNVTAG